MMADGREYPARPLVGIAAVVFRGGTVLLIRRARPPRAGALSFPGGAQRLGETAEEAARRELREETGLEAGALRLASHADVIEREAPGSPIRFHFTILHFAGEAADPAAPPLAAGDVSGAFFVALGGLEAVGLDTAHREVVTRAHRLLHPIESAGTALHIAACQNRRIP